MVDEEFLVDESEFSFKMKDKEEEGSGNEGCRFWFIREDSEYFKLSGEGFIDKKLDCELSEKYDYVSRLDDYWDEVNEKLLSVEWGVVIVILFGLMRSFW